MTGLVTGQAQQGRPVSARLADPQREPADSCWPPARARSLDRRWRVGSLVRYPQEILTKEAR